MIDFEQARSKMVDCQVRTSDVTDHALISALLSVPREEFVDTSKSALAYIDEDLSLAPIGPANRFLMEPAPFAKLVQLAEVSKNDVVLVVGAGSGYSSAVLSILASSVVAIEEDRDLVKFASEKLGELGFDNVAVLQMPLAGGCEKEAPFDVILVDGSVEMLPNSLLEQLASGGRLVAVEGSGNAAVAKVYVKKDNIISDREVMNCAVKPLPGFAQEIGFSF